MLLDRLMKSRKVDTIIHFAGSVVVPESVADPLGYYLNNTVKSRELIAAAVANGVAHFIFSSTAAVYGMPETVPVSEDVPLNPMSPYGASKVMTERMLADAAAAYGLRSVALRYFNVAGADPEGPHRPVDARRDASSSRSRSRRRPASATTSPSSAPTTTRPTAPASATTSTSPTSCAPMRRRSIICAPAARACMLNCGYGRGYSVLEVLDAVQRVSGRTLDIRARARRPGDVPVMVAAADRIRDDARAGSRATTIIETIVAHALAWEEQLCEEARALKPAAN